MYPVVDTIVQAGVHVEGAGANNRGVYRAARTVEPAPLAEVKCPDDPACTPGVASAGWMHVASTYNGTDLEIYVDGRLAGRASFQIPNAVRRRWCRC